MKHTVVSILSVVFTLTAWSQSSQPNPVALPVSGDASSIIFTVDGRQEVTLDEFERQFLKNLNLKEKTITAEDIDTYLKLYVRFKLKIQDAIDAGKDSAEAYKRELAMYREQLARNYLYDRSVTDKLIQEAYERMQDEVNVSHILIRCDRNADPSKVASIMKRMTEIKKALERDPSEKNFADLAASDSEDPGSKSAGGALGYLTALQVVYEFENAAYSTPIGGISDVFRTDFGFHILRVNDKRKNLGEVKARHLLIRTGSNAAQSPEEAEKLIREIHAKIKAGESFEEMAKKHSEDFSSKYSGGNMNAVSVTQYVGDIERQKWAEKAFALQNTGDLTEPFQTNYGWHLLQLVEKKPLKPFDEMKVSLRNKVQQNQRSQIGIDSLVSRVKREDRFVENSVFLETIIKILERDSSFIKGKFDPLSLPEELTINENGKKVNVQFFDVALFQIANQAYTVEQFTGRLAAQKRKVEGSVNDYIREIYGSWVQEACVSYQNEHLEEKSPEFRHIYKEYREGILMFNRMQEMVWEKANKDSIGLAAYFNEHANEYQWNDRYHAAFLFCSNKGMMNQVAKQLKKGLTLDSIRKVHTAKSQLDFSYRFGKYQLSDTFLFPQRDPLKMVFADGKYRKKKNKIYKMGAVGEDFVVVQIYDFLPAGPKTLEETRGPVASKYQEVLEQRWIADLESRYPVNINTEAVGAFKAKLNVK
jgi:peptidyl-prolyl cis-trans isomerase SurA